VVHDQPVPVDEPDAAARLVVGEAVPLHRGADLIRHARPRGSRAEDHQTLIGEPLACDPKAGDHGGKDDRSRTLHVVVEDPIAVRVLREDAARVRRAEVLEMQERLRKEPGDGRQVPVDEGVVLRAADTRVAVPEIQRIVEQGLVVGSDVEVHGDDPTRVDPGRRRVDRQLAHGDVGPVHAPVADAEDLFRIGHRDEVDVVRTELEGGEGLLDVLRAVDREVHRPGDPVVVRPFHDGVADRGVVDDRQKLREMVHQQPVVQGLVPVVQRVQIDVPCEIVRKLLQLTQAPGHLRAQVLDGGGQPADDTEPLTGLLIERRAPIDCRILQDLLGAIHRPPLPPRIHAVDPESRNLFFTVNPGFLF
ncbi:hypothetical protein ABE10_00455, partial [Bacillus toyonensis]|nr:hypothetical protein [Bacillus toyonensis]